MIDWLLASPHYGERWGRHWLDVARYADTRGETKRGASSLSPYAWTYRDYVISALNSDKPFDQFIREQIAADQLSENPDKASLAALGFLTQGDQFMDNRNDIINDQIDVVSKSFLGMTVNCARCHDHFFDPVTQRDYYALHGIFNSCYEPDSGPTVAKPADPKATADYHKAREKLLADGKAKLVNQLSDLAGTVNARADVFLKLLNANRQGPEFFQLLQQAGLDRRQAGDIGRLLQRKIQVMSARGGRGDPTGDPFNPTLDFWRVLSAIPAAEFPARAAAAIGELQKDVKGFRSNTAVREAFAGKAPKSLDEAAKLYAAAFQKAHEAYQKELAEWRKYAPSGTWFPGLKDKSLEEVRISFINPNFVIPMELDSNMRGLPQDLERQVNVLMGEVAKLDTVHPGSPGLANLLSDSLRPKDSAVFIRGQAQQPGPVVSRGFLECFGTKDLQIPASASGRKQLAEAIASKDNPLTARVLINRVWQHHFGEGFVNTPDDLGTMSEKPSHPELLDYLAARFMADGWSLKKLHKTILLSRTWQQSSEPNAENARIDPFNRLLWRANVRKLDFESLRDSVLHMGGKLDPAMGGRPVNIESEPYSPRRSIYGFIDRTQMAEFMRHFDVANPALPTGKRHETIVPQQALFRMNSLLVIEQARNIVDRKEVRQAQNDQDRVRQLYEVIFQRWPKEQEMKLALEFVHAASMPAGSGDDVADGSVPAPGEPKLSPAVEKLISPEALAGKDRDQVIAYIKELRIKGKIDRSEMDVIRKRLVERARNKAQDAARGNSNAVKEAVRDPNAERVDRSPLSNWEQFAHALLMTNEVGYVN